VLSCNRKRTLDGVKLGKDAAKTVGLGLDNEILSFGTDIFENSIRSGMKQW